MTHSTISFVQYYGQKTASLCLYMLGFNGITHFWIFLIHFLEHLIKFDDIP